MWNRFNEVDLYFRRLKARPDVRQLCVMVQRPNADVDRLFCVGLRKLNNPDIVATDADPRHRDPRNLVVNAADRWTSPSADASLPSGIHG
ncbi:unnamed protein product [Gadus morhua 'NCC']